MTLRHSCPRCQILGSCSSPWSLMLDVWCWSRLLPPTVAVPRVGDVVTGEGSPDLPDLRHLKGCQWPPSDVIPPSVNWVDDPDSRVAARQARGVRTERHARGLAGLS